MIFTEEQALLEGRQQFEQMIALVQQAADEHRRIDSLERTLISQLLALGHSLLGLFLAKQGEGDRGETIPAEDGHLLKRLPQPHHRRYLSVFGEHTIARFVYGSREGQKIQHVPLDEQIGLPQSDFSYLLQHWSQRLCLKESFAEAAESLRMLLGLSLGVRALEQINHAVAASAPAFRAQVEPPAATEEGSILVVSADGKGVPMRRPVAKTEPQPHHRRTKGQEANKKQVACVGAVDSIAPFPRNARSIVDEVVRHQQAEERPRPQHKKVWAEMSREVDDFPVRAKEGLFCQLWSELARRNPGEERPVVCLMDGERALWEAKRVYFAEAVGVLDLFHVMERLWAVSHCLHQEGSTEASRFVAEGLRNLLEGRVGSVIGGWRQRLTKGRFSSSRRRVIESAIEYFENNRDHMRYDEYLAAGDPIVSGVAEGACRHLVKDRMEQAGMRWTLTGAQAMLHVRGLYRNDEWEDYMTFHIEREQDRLYGRSAA